VFSVFAKGCFIDICLHQVHVAVVRKTNRQLQLLEGSNLEFEMAYINKQQV